MIITAKTSDANQLTQIALTSKAFWGYNDELLQSWKDDLTVTATMITEMNVYTFIFDEKIVGFYILNQPKENTVELEFLFVLPEFIGKGIGKQLLKHVIEKAKTFMCTSITVLADPNAEDFYKSHGFTVFSQKESSVKGRFLPIMEKLLV